MTLEGKPKVPPIEVIAFRAVSNRVLLEPDDFVDMITEKDLMIIRGKQRLGLRGWKYIYFALDEPLTYYTITKEELSGVKVDIVVKTPQWTW